MKSPKKQGPTEQELKLAELGEAKYNLSKELGGGIGMFKTQLDRDDSARSVERARSDAAVQLAQLDPSTGKLTLPVDTKTMANINTAANADEAHKDNQLTNAIASNELGHNATISRATAMEGQREAQLDHAKIMRKSAQEDALLGLGASALSFGVSGGFDGMFKGGADKAVTGKKTAVKNDSTLNYF